MDMFVVGAVAVLAAMSGFWIGRSLQWQLADAADGMLDGSAESNIADSNMSGSNILKSNMISGNMTNNNMVNNNMVNNNMVNNNVTSNNMISNNMMGNDMPDSNMYSYNMGGNKSGYNNRDANYVNSRNDFFNSVGDRDEDSRRHRSLFGAKADKRRQVKTLSTGREIGSPVAGQVSMFEENGKRKVRILPDQGKIYAPASGKIQHLYPMGSAMLLKTEFGAEIMLKAGQHVDEMCSDFYRCRVMEHEVVRKGTLLLEYDPAKISAEGADPGIVMSIENEEEFGGMTVTSQNRMKAGEPILYVVCGKHSESYEKIP